jgi:hypothetical protein
MIYLTMALGLILCFVGVRDAGSTILTCHRLEPGQINCHQEKTIWLGWVKLSEIELNRVQQIKLQRLKGGTTYPLLVTATGETPLYDFGPTQISDLNNFINSTEPSLLLRQSRWGTMLVEWFIGGLLIGAGRLSLWVFNEGGAKIAFRQFHQSLDQR